MKTKLLFTSLLLGAQISFAQQILNEDFDAYTVGNVASDLTGNTAGASGWKIFTAAGGNASNFKFAAEAGKGNVLAVTGPNSATTSQNNNAGYVFKDFPANAWTGRATGNNILRVEYEFYTGTEPTSLSNHRNFAASANNIVAGYNYDPKTRILSGLTRVNVQGQVGLYLIKLGQKGGNPDDLVVPADTWIKVYYQIDYTTSKINYQIPSLSVSGEIQTVSLANDAPVEVDFSTLGLTGNTVANTIKYDNFAVSAVNTTVLGVNDPVSSKFNLYPNPVNDIVTISNGENIGIEQVTITDLSGRAVRTYELNQQSEIQLNISDLNAGIYIFNVKTKEGTAVKKVIKK